MGPEIRARGAADMTVSCCAREGAVTSSNRHASSRRGFGASPSLPVHSRTAFTHARLARIRTDFFFLRALSLRAPLTLRQADICVREDKQCRKPPSQSLGRRTATPISPAKRREKPARKWGKGARSPSYASPSYASPVSSLARCLCRVPFTPSRRRPA